MTDVRIRLVAEIGAGVGVEAPAGERVRAASPRAAALSGGGRRVALCMSVMALAYLILLARLGALAVGADTGAATERLMAAAGAAETAIAQSSKSTAVAALRPDILDRKGRPLATYLPVRRASVDGRNIWGARETAEALGRVIPELDVAWLEERLAARRYIELHTELSPEMAAAVHDLGLPGVKLIEGERRVYPNGPIAAHVIGYADGTGAGVAGLEKAVNGADAPFRSSIDIVVQRTIETELHSAIDEFSAVAGWAVLMDVATGEVIALASAPDFDPNMPGAAEPDARRNRAVSDNYELGSAFKALTAAAVVDAGVADEETLYDARKPVIVGGWPVDDYHGKDMIMSLTEVVAYSSNIGSTRAALELGAERQRAFLKRFGLLDPVVTELPEQRSPRPPRQWGPAEIATVSYGHGLAVTPLHLVQAFAPLVNGGCKVAPTFRKRDKAAPCEQVMNPRSSLATRRMLKAVTDYGSGKNARADGYHVIGKTATADKPIPGGYDTENRLSSFVGAFPGHDPAYVLLVSLDEPQGTAETHGFATAGYTAAPVFSRIVTRVAPMLGLAPADEGVAMAGFMGLGAENHFAGLAGEDVAR